MTYLDIAARGKNHWWRYLIAWPLALLIWMTVTAVILIPLVLTRVLSAEQLQAQSAGAHPVTFFALQGIVFAALIAGFALAARLMHGKKFTDLCGRWRWPHVAIGFGLWLVVLILNTGIDWALRPAGFTVTIHTLTPALIATTIVCLAIQTFAEEFIFRGYLTQGLLLATKQPVAASILSGLIFGAMHIPNGTPQAINAAIMGVVFAFITIRTGSLALAWGMHFVNNLFGAVVVVSANDVFKDTPAVITQNTPDLMWIDLAFGTVALIAVLAWVWKNPSLSAPAGLYRK